MKQHPITPLRGDFIMRSPDFTPPKHHHEEGPMSEFVDHVAMEALGLGGLGIVLGVIKMKKSLAAANTQGAAPVAVRPSAAISPSKSFKPGA